MTEKNIFAYKLCLSLNISDFIFLSENCNSPPPKISHPLFPSNPLLKVEVLLTPPFWKSGWRFNPPIPSRRGEGVQTMGDEQNLKKGSNQYRLDQFRSISYGPKLVEPWYLVCFLKQMTEFHGFCLYSDKVTEGPIDWHAHIKIC